MTTKQHSLNLSEFPNASLTRRLAAMLYDSLLVLAVSMLYGAVFILLKTQVFDIPVTEGESAAKGPLFQFGLVVTVLLFFIGFWLGKGQTLGMRTWRLHLVSLDNKPLSLKQAIVRALCASLSLLLAGLGFFWILIDKDRLSWHDKISNSKIVVGEKLNNKTQRGIK